MPSPGYEVADRTLTLLLDQPCVLTLRYEAGERRRGFTYTPDFFILTRTGAELIECKYEAELRKLIDPQNPKAQPWRYELTAQGTWTCPPGVEAAAELGLKFRVFSTNDAPVTLLNNFDFLADYYDRAFSEEQQS